MNCVCTNLKKGKGKNKNFLPDIEPVYMSEKNSNHVKEIDDN